MTRAIDTAGVALFAAFGRKLGFVTPTLWANQVCFDDITEGNNLARRKAAMTTGAEPAAQNVSNLRRFEPHHPGRPNSSGRLIIDEWRMSAALVMTPRLDGVTVPARE